MDVKENNAPGISIATDRVRPWTWVYPERAWGSI